MLNNACQESNHFGKKIEKDLPSLGFGLMTRWPEGGRAGQ